MRRLATAMTLGLAMATTACLDTTDPIPLVDGRVAHAIPGIGPANVSVDLTPTFQLQPLGFNYFVVAAMPRTWDFELADQSLTVQVQHNRDITAIILLDLDGPVLRTYHLDRDGPEQRIAVINGHSAAGDMQVAISGVDSSFDLTVAPGEVEVIEPFTGDFSVSVRGEDDDVSHELDPFTLETNDYGFLVIVPGPEPEQPYTRILF